MTETVETLTAVPRPTFAFVGAGRAGSALATALHAAGHRVVAVHSRTRGHAHRLAEATGAVVSCSSLAAMQLADITFATVPDSEVAGVADSLASAGVSLRGRALVHCSATHGCEVLAAVRGAGALTGAFHPLQALTGAGSAPRLRGSGFTVEAEEPLHTTLVGLVADLGGHLLDLPASGRALYHAAAVLAGNAPLALLARATSLLEEAGIPRADAHRALSALLCGAAANAAEGGAAGALTGPVVRGDAATVTRHLEVLAADPSTRELYRRLALESLTLAGPEGRETVAEALAAPPPSRPARVVPHPRVA